MANHPSSLKRMRSSEKRRQRNRIVRGRARTAIKKTRINVAEQNWEDAELALQTAISALDKAAQKGVIHKNNAARRKSRLVRHYNQAKAAAAQ
ncbi:MAG: 30S ribosomal protein S20 [Caldilineales bacterium]